MDDTNENIPVKNQTPKPPPIFIQAQLNFNNFCIKIKELTDSTGFDCKSSTNKLRLQTYSADSYRTVINYLKENNVSFHSYQSKELKAFRAVIRNLHPTTDLSFIKKELLDSGFTTRNIMPVFHKLTKTPLPIFFIDLEPGPTNADIFKITSLCYTIVKIELAHPKRDIPQCHRYHTPVLLHIRAQPLMKPNRPTITPRFTNWNKFRGILSKKTILNIKLKSPSNIDSAINKLTNDIQVAAKDSSTLRPSNNPSSNLTPELRKLLADKRRARSIWQRTRYPDDKSRYNMLSNKLKSLLKIHKNDSYKNYLQNLSLKNGSLWRKTKSILRLKEITPP
ncbi:hypothetical protein QTP88_012327 [Uroleucon formosanum]